MIRVSRNYMNEFSYEVILDNKKVGLSHTTRESAEKAERRYLTDKNAIWFANLKLELLACVATHRLKDAFRAAGTIIDEDISTL